MKRTIIAILLCLASAPALAHHPLAGAPLETFTHGLLSGVGHPLLGFDHLFFVALAGIAAALTRFPLRAPLAYLGAMLGGCLLTSLWQAIPLAEWMVAFSLLALGTMLLRGRGFGTPALLSIFALFGLFHGSAFGGTLAAQEAGFGIAVLAGYLAGLALTQYAIALAAGKVYITLCSARDPAAIQPRLAGAMVAGVGLYLVLERVEGALLGALV